jgi:uncharacterized protein (DUF736 family)
MSIIGTFTKTADGFTGAINTLSLNVPSVEFQAVEKKGGGPDFRIMSGATVLGAAWKKTSKANRDYISVKLDDPSLPRSVSAALFDGEDGYNLVWSRPQRRRSANT